MIAKQYRFPLPALSRRFQIVFVAAPLSAVDTKQHTPTFFNSVNSKFDSPARSIDRSLLADRSVCSWLDSTGTVRCV